MKHLFRILAIGFFLFVAPTWIYAEEIQQYHSNINIERDGIVRIKERIGYEFTGADRHGIFRIISSVKTNANNEKYTLSFSDFSVRDEKDITYPFVKTEDSNTIQLKIGDPNKTVSGLKNYTIGYAVAGAITYFSDHDELFWQITGTEWPVSIQKASATVQIPIATNSSDIKATCYVGNKESTKEDCSISVRDAVAEIQTNTKLASNEGLTVVVGFPKGIIAQVEPKKIEKATNGFMAAIIGFVIFLAVFIWYIAFPIWIVVRWFAVGRDPKPAMGEVKAWFDVPKTRSLRLLTPGETGTLVDESADMREITGTIIDLARRGYMKIVETKKNDFSLEKRNAYEKGDTLEPFEQLLYEGLFSKGDILRIKDADLISTVKKTKDALYESVVKEKFFDKNPQTTRTIYTVFGAIGIFMFNVPLALAAFIFGRAMPRKTILGSQNAAIARSLRNFLVSQDRQFAYQAKKQLFFEKFLPYAIVFGVEKIWAERFKDIKLTKPDWYDGYGNNVFTSAYLVSSLNSSMHSVVTAATPTSSSSGFSSGFSGGSVGGGGGGGGGGSW